MRNQLSRLLSSNSFSPRLTQSLSRSFSTHSPLVQVSVSLTTPAFTGLRQPPALLKRKQRALYSTARRYHHLRTHTASSLTHTRSHATHSGNSSPESQHKLRLEANSFHTALLVTTVAAGVLIASLWSKQDSPSSASFPKEEEEEEEEIIIMAIETLPGRPGGLTPDEEDKLRKLWASIFQLTGVSDDGTAAADILATKDEAPTEAASTEHDGKKKRLGIFKKKDGKSGHSTPTESTAGDEDKYGQTKHFYETLAKESPENIRRTIWSMVKHDHPDALVLRFLRARKWDVEKALVMLVSTMSWRHVEMHVDDEIMKNGDSYAIEDSKKPDSSTKQVSADFVEQLRMGKSFLHGTDKNGRPICYVRVRLHKAGEQCEESLEKYTVYIIETARMVLETPVDTAVSFWTWQH